MQREARPLLMSADELFARPDDAMRHELLLGHLASEPPPGYRHGRLVIRIGSLLEMFVRGSDLGEVVVADVGFILSQSPDTVRAPDVAFVSRERLRFFVDRAKYFPGAPDLAVEVLSPSERAGTIHGKIAEYLAAGTRAVWAIDPEAQTVSIHHPALSPRVVAGDQELDGEDLLPGFSVRVAELFSD